MKGMFNALVTLYQSVNINRKFLLKNELTMTQVSDTNIVASYLMKITELSNQFNAIGVKVEDDELVPIAINESHCTRV